MRIFARSKCRIAAINIGLCFPDLSRVQQRNLVQRCIAENCRWILTTARAWCRTAALKQEASCSRVEGLEVVQEILDNGGKIIFYQGHQTHMDIALYLFTRHFPLCPTYRAYRSSWFNRFMVRARMKMATKVIDIRQSRTILRALKQYRTLWITADQDLGAKNAVFAPFFGQDCAWHQGVRKWAKISGAKVCFLSTRRIDHLHYVVTIHPPLADFPSTSAHADILRQNALLEAAIRAVPEQYLWLHRRFKTRPRNLVPVYHQ